MAEETEQTRTPKSRTSRNNSQVEIKTSSTGEDTGQTNTEKSQLQHKGGKPSGGDTPEPEKWTIKGVDRDTRAIIQKVAARSGKPLSRWFNEDVRAFAQSQLKKGNNTPARQEDLNSDLLNRLRSELKAEQSEDLKALRKAIESRPASLWEWLTGRKNK